jgi:outer membrane protein assembly factor BamD
VIRTPLPIRWPIRWPILLLCLLLAPALLLSGCKDITLFGSKSNKELEGLDAEQLYNKAKVKLDDGSYSQAVEYYEALEARYPFGSFAQQGLLDLAYAYYKQEESASTVATCDRFIKLYPSHPHIDYAYYLKGLANFNQGKGMGQRFLPQDVSQRDPGAANQAFQDFSQLIQKFPRSKYIEDAKLRMTYLRNILAQYEVNVATYYMRREAFVAAANRARYVVENYQQTPAVPDALVIMAKAYKILRMDDLSLDALRVLELNYPKHPGIQEVHKIVVKD